MKRAKTPNHVQAAVQSFLFTREVFRQSKHTKSPLFKQLKSFEDCIT